MSIKLRVALVFTAALAIAFAVGGWLYISQLHAQLLKGLDSTVKAQLAPYKSAHTVSDAAAIPVPDNTVVQLVDPSDRVLRQRSEASSAPLLTPDEVRVAMLSGLTKTAGDEQYRFHAA